MIRPNDLIDGKYEILRLIGEGGMSRVWLARDFYLDKKWAIKEVDKGTPGSASLEVDCLVEEALLLKTLDHPMLPRVVEVLETNDAVLLVMDYVRGKPLSEVLAQHGGPLDEEDVVAWGLSLCEALGYLHSQRPPVIYRDMKPSNIMLCDDGSIRLIDFGIARARFVDGPCGPSLGTRAYAAPEQLDCNRSCDERSDIYSLGVTLGRLAGMDAAQEGARGEVQGLANVVLKATRADPEKRYQCAAEMAEGLRACGEGIAGQAFEPAEDYGQCAPGRGKGRRGLWRVIAGGAACFVACLLWLGWRGAVAVSDERDRSSLLAAAQRASREEEGGGESEAERLCRQAIEVDEGEAEPYLVLLRDVYLDDARFTLEEATRWEGIAQDHLGALEGCEGYPEVCYEAGMLYYAFFEEGEDVRGAARGARWFQACSRACTSMGEEGHRAGGTDFERLAQQADSYAVICGFYRDITLARQSGGEGEEYLKYWHALQGMVDETPNDERDETGSRDTLVQLRLCVLVCAALESPTHLTGFARSGVTRAEAEDLWAKVRSLARTMALRSGLSETEELKWKEVSDADDCITANVTTVFDAQAGIS